MKAKCITPILNVSDMTESVEWFEKLGWFKSWDWGDPVDFGCVGSGEAEIFLCLDGQGGRDRHSANGGVWMSIWVDDVDRIYKKAIDNGIEVLCKPRDMPWGVYECHLRHPDGHVFRVSK